MTAPYKFDYRITLSNDEGHEDVVFESYVSGEGEQDLLVGDIPAAWHKAAAMSDERADDGTDWTVEITCLSVTDPRTGMTDWNDDCMPQRDEVTVFLNSSLSLMAPADA